MNYAAAKSGAPPDIALADGPDAGSAAAAERISNTPLRPLGDLPPHIADRTSDRPRTSLEDHRLADHPSYAAAAAAHVRGKAERAECDHCVLRLGPFVSCFRTGFRGEYLFSGSCTYCYWGNQGTRCSLCECPPPLSARQQPTKPTQVVASLSRLLTVKRAASQHGH